MERRSFARRLGAGTVAWLAGCSSQATTGRNSTPTAPPAGLAITGLFPRERERTFFDYEYVELKNAGQSPLDVTDYVLQYGSGHEYVVPELRMEPGSLLIVSSRSGENAVLARSPPIYHHFAGFGEGTDTSVMDDSGTVTLLDPSGAVVDDASFDTVRQ